MIGKKIEYWNWDRTPCTGLVLDKVQKTETELKKSGYTGKKDMYGNDHYEHHQYVPNIETFYIVQMDKPNDDGSNIEWVEPRQIFKVY